MREMSMEQDQARELPVRERETREREMREREMFMKQALGAPEGQGLHGVQHSAVVGVGLRHHDASATVAAIYSDMQIDDARRALQLENDDLRKTCEILMESHAMQMQALRQQQTRAIALHEAKRKVETFYISLTGTVYV